MAKSFRKDPNSVLDYKIDWTNWLAYTSPADTISTSSWTADSGITIDSSSKTTRKATVWLSGGTVGGEYEVTNRIVTAAGRTVDRSIWISVVER